ncbi:forespore regulator of the sigma-K checkpoint [Amphibacillus marinus]|uniref:Forespore regulator of the sigma-K checkpoint n=1 Tax=Amphibacillus marinus TaxID=872970 RepID=A0A1H8P0M2_9BACI|nr:BofC C-terminal domain-containing protein [Amphibacillus marinus]SEO35422.1 forespore regulator of the sigma-K checkpoint [Amphibacillus marinus]
MKNLRYFYAINLCLLFFILIYSYVNQSGRSIEDEDSLTVAQLEQQAKYPEDLARIEVTIQQEYLDGRIESETIIDTITAMDDFWADYQDYQLIDQKVGQMVFREQIEDISPYIKEVGYFGLVGDHLAIFEGEPENNQAIEILYPINKGLITTDQLGSLKGGIKISSQAVYQETIAVFGSRGQSESVQAESDLE